MILPILEETTKDNTSNIIILVLLIVITIALLGFVCITYSRLSIKKDHVDIVKKGNKDLVILNEGVHWIVPFIDRVVSKFKIVNNKYVADLLLLRGTNTVDQLNIKAFLLFNINNPISYFNNLKDNKEKMDFDVILVLQSLFNEVGFDKLMKISVDDKKELLNKINEKIVNYGIEYTDFNLVK